jgi:hypothetical protein
MILSFGHTKAQDPYTIQIDKQNGLPSNAVYDIFQDKKGFIWMATDVGLYRYDGSVFKSYQSANQTSLSGSSIREDQFGRIWYENFDGYLHYVENDSLHALQQQKPIAYLPVSFTLKYLFVFQKKGIDVYDLKTLRFVKTFELSTLVSEHCTSDAQNFYFIINDILYKIDENLRLYENKYFEGKPAKLKQMLLAGNEIVVVGRYNESKKMYFFDKNLNFTSYKPISEPVLVQGMSFIDQKFWVHTPNGTWVYPQDSRTSEKVYLKDKSIASVLKDRQSNYWFSTTNEGVCLATHLNHLFYPFPRYTPNKMAITEAGFLVATKKGEILEYDSLMSLKGIIKEKTDNSEIYYIQYDSLQKDIFFSSKGFTHLPNKSYSQRIFYELALKEMIRLDDKYYAFSSSGYCGLLKTAQQQGVSAWDDYFEKNKIVNVKGTAKILDALRGKSVAYHSEKQTIYFATNVGLYKTTPSYTKEVTFQKKPFFASRLFVYKNDLYALSTRGNLYHIENESNFVLLNAVLGVEESEIRLVKQFDKYLFVVSKGYVHLFDLETKKSHTVNIRINTSDINDFVLKNQYLFLLTNNGIVRVYLNDKETNGKSTYFHINRFTVNGTGYPFAEKIYLEYDQNDIHIHFSILDFGSTQPQKLYYRINGSKWKEVASTQSLQFASMASGNYVVEFKINEEITHTKLEFSIDTPFWKTPYFIFTSIFVVLGLIWMYYRLQLQKLKAKNKLLEDKMALEQQLNKSVLTSIKSQMNPHFFYNALNTIQAYIFTNDKMKANTYLAKFSKLTRLILEHSEKDTISLAEEADALILYLELEKMRFKEDFHYHIDFIDIVSKESIELPPMIIQPYVENAIKHGLLHKDSEKELFILFKMKQHDLIVEIDDNGIGRKRSMELNRIKNEKYQSFSSQANEKRLEILNKATNQKVGVEIIDKMDVNHAPIGTKVILTIPIR